MKWLFVVVVYNTNLNNNNINVTLFSYPNKIKQTRVYEYQEKMNILTYITYFRLYLRSYIKLSTDDDDTLNTVRVEEKAFRTMYLYSIFGSEYLLWQNYFRIYIIIFWLCDWSREYGCCQDISPFFLCRTNTDSISSYHFKAVNKWCLNVVLISKGKTSQDDNSDTETGL